MKEQKNEENMAEEELQLNRPSNIEKTTAASIITPNFYVFPNPLLGKFKNLILGFTFYCKMFRRSIFHEFSKDFIDDSHIIYSDFKSI